jgi:DNA repair exonuclease SbcCD ATPase subunit
VATSPACFKRALDVPHEDGPIVIEFALLFGLGFLSALLIMMLIGPAIHRRIVVFTENRIRATVPISPQEVRAQRDLARAQYAAENARTKQELVQERDKVVTLQVKSETLRDEMKSLVAENIELKTILENTDVAAADMRSQLRQEDNYIAELKAALETSEETGVAKDLEIDNLTKRMDMLTAQSDNARIDLSTRETEIENLKFRISALREERDELRRDVKLLTTRAKDAEGRLTQEEHKALRLEDKLSKEISTRTDKETAIERRDEEIARLREKVKDRVVAASAAADARQEKAEDAVETSVFTAEAEDLSASSQLPETPLGAAVATNAASLAGEAQNRATALSERLLNGKGKTNDDTLRQEMAAIAAGMVAMTALTEGKSSPIHPMLSGKSATGTRQSLAARVKTLLGSAGEAAGR